MIGVKLFNPVENWDKKPKDLWVWLVKNLWTQWEIEEENRKRSSKREVLDFFAYVVIVMIDLAGQPRFFVRIAICLVIDRAVSIEKKVAINFFGLFL